MRAVESGEVMYAEFRGISGNTVILGHGGGYYSVYLHLQNLTVSTGDRVEARQVIGLSGSTGNVTGPHLHFEVWRWGRPVDPVPLLGGPPSG